MTGQDGQTYYHGEMSAGVAALLIFLMLWLGIAVTIGTIKAISAATDAPMPCRSVIEPGEPCLLP